MSRAEITIIMASKNGTDTLPPVFGALAECTLPDCNVEYVLVDNNSDDETHELMLAFAKERDAQVLIEHKPGKSFALNAAIETASGGLLVFIDDDALPAANWLVAYHTAYQEQQNHGVFIGQVRPKFLAPAPQWLQQLSDIGRSFACTPIAQEAGPCSPRLAKGLNWAIRRSALGADRFDVDGTNLLEGRKPVGGQDTEMARRLARKGVGVQFVPDAIALHQVQPHEMTPKSIFERYRRIGRGTAAQRTHSPLITFTLPVVLPTIALLGAVGWICGAKRFAGMCLTRFASNFGRGEYFLEEWFSKLRPNSIP